MAASRLKSESSNCLCGIALGAGQMWPPIWMICIAKTSALAGRYASGGRAEGSELMSFGRPGG